VRRSKRLCCVPLTSRIGSHLQVALLKQRHLVAALVLLFLVADVLPVLSFSLSRSLPYEANLLRLRGAIAMPRLTLESRADQRVPVFVDFARGAVRGGERARLELWQDGVRVQILEAPLLAPL
jgi:hypothetical protein